MLKTNERKRTVEWRGMEDCQCSASASVVLVISSSQGGVYSPKFWADKKAKTQRPKGPSAARSFSWSVPMRVHELSSLAHHFHAFGSPSPPRPLADVGIASQTWPAGTSAPFLSTTITLTPSHDAATKQHDAGPQTRCGSRNFSSAAANLDAAQPPNRRLGARGTQGWVTWAPPRLHS